MGAGVVIVFWGVILGILTLIWAGLVALFVIGWKKAGCRVFDVVHGSMTVLRADDSISFAYLPYAADLRRFAELAEPPMRAAQRGENSMALDAVDMFLAMLGGFAGNVALTYGALGGVYIGGGIVPRLAWRIADSPFRERFEAKGRFQHYLREIPTYLITAENPTLFGVRSILDEALNRRPASDLLAEIRERLPELAKAFRLVAEDLLAAPGAFVESPTSQIATRAGVSDPTIMRFLSAPLDMTAFQNSNAP
ncbi:MAG: hypothetical protein HC782_00035, partial [Gammaproteobacteria bacterium]|nr:hypothetical protein [Gammaproteobacteria bacterium]